MSRWGIDGTSPGNLAYLVRLIIFEGGPGVGITPSTAIDVGHRIIGRHRGSWHSVVVNMKLKADGASRN